MRSNDVDFCSFQIIYPELARVTYITYNSKHFVLHIAYKGPLHWRWVHNNQQGTKSEYRVPPLLIFHVNH